MENYKKEKYPCPWINPCSLPDDEADVCTGRDHSVKDMLINARQNMKSALGTSRSLSNHVKNRYPSIEESITESGGVFDFFKVPDQIKNIKKIQDLPLVLKAFQKIWAGIEQMMKHSSQDKDEYLKCLKDMENDLNSIVCSVYLILKISCVTNYNDVKRKDLPHDLRRPLQNRDASVKTMLSFVVIMNYEKLLDLSIDVIEKIINCQI